ncbi:hypothetical protein KNT80_gp91 [Vibrio phage 1.245.O._10N.261.54.C7]|uniref:Uncharacterized protein n=1 Tax=Vibrio phage 1.245.O._10N.261.54.C7 TaxID=1881236 RepID=A0A2I7RWI5_9CAUD|nr:hypothetical protein KNT80_gp91 [Vibrio phage 1.245.O._10N.261.54.C7]AUR98004.1 hypothetical protein NVP1245O_91 [Vibrio phage 1.245.O._10N.261.54.C7]
MRQETRHFHIAKLACASLIEQPVHTWSETDREMYVMFKDMLKELQQEGTNSIVNNLDINPMSAREVLTNVWRWCF